MKFYVGQCAAIRLTSIHAVYFHTAPAAYHLMALCDGKELLVSKFDDVQKGQEAIDDLIEKLEESWQTPL